VTAFALFGVIGQAQSATVSLSNITGTWFDADPGSVVTSNSGGGTSSTEIRWSASGYNFIAAAGASANVPPSPSPSFVLGTFQHVNQPIFSDAITAVSLRVQSDIMVDAVTIGPKQFEFRFTHDETPNDENPCAYGGANNQGVNINGCADRVTVSFLQGSESFFVGNDEYTLRIVGFVQDDSPTTAFLTAERQINTALLRADVVLRSDVTTPPIPEPSTYAMLMLGLGGIAAAARRRRS
jgi:hypothetical protein